MTQRAPIAHWPLDGDGVDASGGGRDLELAGGVRLAEGLSKQAIDLTGDPSEYARRPGDDAIFDFGAGDFRVQVWMSIDGTAGKHVLKKSFVACRLCSRIYHLGRSRT